MIHELKTLPEYFKEVELGNKTFEVRKNDRNFQIDDILLLKEFDGQEYTGKQIEVKVIYILNGGNFGINNEYCVMSIKKEHKISSNKNEDYSEYDQYGVNTTTEIFG